MYKTLKELNVKVGDVVQYRSLGFSNYTIKAGSKIRNDQTGFEFYYSIKERALPNWLLISRATPEYKTWGESSDIEKGALLLAQHKGEVVQYLQVVMGIWHDNGETGKFFSSLKYRIKPSPVAETVEIDSVFDQTISVQVVDGVVQPDTIKMT